MVVVKGKGILGSEVLSVAVAQIFVQPMRGANPDMSESILRYRCHPRMGEVAGKEF